MTTLDQWLELAPKPWELKPEQKWHVFLSYRSVNRPWVIQLYDVLRHLGFEVFLDQYVLAASSHLVASLEEGLEKSASGVLVWSTAAEDSKWCQKEYLTMEALTEEAGGFNYVVTKLDKVDLPLFARQRLYLDFSDFREGPRGSGLLKLLYGLQGEPLPSAAVNLAAEVDEEVNRSLVEIRGAIDNGNKNKLLALADSDSLAWNTTPVLACQIAEGLIKLNCGAEALSAIAGLEQRFPKAIRPAQLKGLALARTGDREAAQDVLDNLVAAGEQDPETLGIYARTWMDRYAESGNNLHLRKSRDLYLKAFEGTPSDYYTGINAASKSVLLGELDTAAQIADRVEAIVGKEKHEDDYWGTATVAEVQLIKRNFDEAASLYQEALVIASEEIGSHQSTWQQTQRLMEKLEPSPAEREKIATTFAHLETT